MDKRKTKKEGSRVKMSNNANAAERINWSE